MSSYPRDNSGQRMMRRSTSGPIGDSTVKREMLLTAILDGPVVPDDVLYLERRGEEYDIAAMANDKPMSRPAAGTVEPDAWIYFAGHWPRHDRPACERMLDNLLAELESMLGGVDRCRWPLDEPWPHKH